MGGGRQDFHPEGEAQGMGLLLQRLEVTIKLADALKIVTTRAVVANIEPSQSN
jgi:hypothetical protein